MRTKAANRTANNDRPAMVIWVAASQPKRLAAMAAEVAAMRALRFTTRLRAGLFYGALCGFMLPCIAAGESNASKPLPVTDKLQATCLPAQLQLIRGIKVSRTNDDVATLFIGNSQAENARAVRIPKGLAVRINLLPGDKICGNKH